MWENTERKWENVWECERKLRMWEKTEKIREIENWGENVKHKKEIWNMKVTENRRNSEKIGERRRKWGKI